MQNVLSPHRPQESHHITSLTPVLVHLNKQCGQGPLGIIPTVTFPGYNFSYK